MRCREAALQLRRRDSLAFAAGRQRFGQAIGDTEPAQVRATLADSQTEIYAAESMALDAARRRASETRGRVVDRALQNFRCAG